MYRIEHRIGWAVALAIVALAIAVPRLAYSLASTAPLQEDDEEEVQISTSGNRLVFDVKRSTASFESSPDGTFVHASSGVSLFFDEGQPLRYDGVDGEAEIERMAVRGGQVLIYLDKASRAGEKIGDRPLPLADGAWTNRQAGTGFVVEDGSIVKCRGFEPGS